jgi:hypothetical protein
MSLLTVLAICALVVLLLYAFNQWGPGDATIKRPISLVAVIILILWVVLWTLNARGII